ncbi:MAG: hypothetical protein VKL59_13100 [Nostocaceae cyanobacterium]|nr:hypothetical protein [Nostocaceae cyanobacterium]
MKLYLKLTSFISLLSGLIVITPTASIAQTETIRLPTNQPNLSLSVQRQRGICPDTVRLWTNYRYYEGGAEHTVIADTLAVAGNIKVVSYGNRFVEYSAPLKEAYKSCIGRAIYKELPYRFQFQNGQVYFRVGLPQPTASKPSEFTRRAILGSRPYVRWAIAD